MNKLFRRLLTGVIICFTSITLTGCFTGSVEATIIDLNIFTGISEDVVSDITVLKYEYSQFPISVQLTADIIWQNESIKYKELRVSWEIIGSTLGCEVYVIDPHCTNGTLATLKIGEETGTGKVTLRATAISKNSVTSDLTIWIDDIESRVNSVDYEIAFEYSGNKQLFGNSNSDKLFEIHTVEELEQLVDSGQIQSPDAMSAILSSTLLNRYDEDYFDKNILVLTSLKFANGPCENEIANLRRASKSLILDLNKVSQGAASSIYWWNFILEIEKSQKISLEGQSGGKNEYAHFLIKWIDSPKYKEIADFNRFFKGEFKLSILFPSLENTSSQIDGYILKKVGDHYILGSDDLRTFYSFQEFEECLNVCAMYSFSTTDPKYSIFGVSVGSSLKEAAEIFEQHGYTRDNNSYTPITYSLGNINIFILASDISELGIITKISVILDVENIEELFY